MIEKNKPTVHGRQYTNSAKMKTMIRELELNENPDIYLIRPLGQVANFIIKPKNEYCPTIWVVSPGASGSSLLYDNIGRCFGTEEMIYPVIKSHSYHIKWKNKNCLKGIVSGGCLWEIEKQDKVIYLYSHPLNILLSFYEKINDDYEGWAGGNPHYIEFLECDTDEDFNKNYLYNDILNLEKHLDKWWRQNDFDCLCIKYENLYNCESIIENFVRGRLYSNVKLPPKRQRKTDWRTHPHKEQLLQTYASVIEKFEQKPDYEIFSKENK